MAGPDFAAALPELDQALRSIEAVVDPERKRTEIAELEVAVAAPDLWDDPENAQRVTSQLSVLQSEVDRVTGLRSRLDDLGVLVELGQEEDDAASLAEAETELASLRQAIEALEVRTLLSGEYDEREALVTIRSEAGGVDAADFAAMLLRMYLRWAERHGSPPRSTTPPTPRRRGSSRRPSRSRRRSRTGLFRSSRAPTGWSGSRRSTTRAGGRPRSPGSRCCR